MAKEAPVATKIGLLAVRRSVLINASPERVWQEFESLEKMRLWFGTGHTLLKYEPRVGADVELSIEHDGRTLYYGGQITAFDPPNELTFESIFSPNEDGWDAPTLITIRLTAALGGTIVELFHHSIERIGTGAAESHRGFESGWTTVQLEALREIVEA
jgi:uncharacterized protein YndB with AHSA1/START domain